MYVATTMANSCAAANVSRTALPEIPLSPHQPGAGFKFPKRSFGKKTVVTRSFQAGSPPSEELPTQYNDATETEQFAGPTCT